MFKKIDFFIVLIICLFLGIFIVSQYQSGREYRKVIQPENNEIIAIEVAKLTKSNADLRQEVGKLTSDLDSYKNTSESGKKLYEKYLSDSALLDIVNGSLPKKGQGVSIKIDGSLSEAQIIDLINAIKNIGSSIMSVNGQRITIATNISDFSDQNGYSIDVLGNSKLLKSAIERKGGIIEQLSSKDIKISISENEDISIPLSNDILQFNYAKILKN